MIFMPVSKGILTFCIMTAITSQCMAQGWSWFRRSEPRQNTQQTQPTQAQYPQGGQYYSSGNSYNYGTQPTQQRAVPSYGQQNYQQQSKPAPAPTRKKSKTSQNSPDTNRWYTDWNDAWDAAKRSGRPLVVIVVHHGCPVCDQLDATLANPAAMATLDSAIKARLEFSNNSEFLHRTGVSLTPTFLVFSPASGGEVYREVGALSLQRLQSLKPSIDSLVSEPAQTATKSRKSADSENSDEISDETTT